MTVSDYVMKLGMIKNKVLSYRLFANHLMSIFIFSILALLMSCAAPTYRLYEGNPMPQEEIAVLITPADLKSKTMLVLSVDGRKPRYATYYGSKWNCKGRIELLPGEHTLLVYIHYIYDHQEGEMNINFIAQAGKTYILKDLKDNWVYNEFKIWVEEENMLTKK